MSVHRFARSSLYGDYARAGTGLALTLVPLVFLDPLPVLAWIFAALAALFAWFALRTAIRHMSRVEMGPHGIVLEGPRRVAVPWDELADVRLAYFAPRRLRRGRGLGAGEEPEGWLQLSLIAGDGSRLDVDSTLDGFTEVLAQAHRVIRSKDLALDPATSSNFAAIGLGSPADGDAESAVMPRR